ncbi:MAG: 5-oxoprolinase subunit PxpB [Methylobacteriaceae bacterium]|nr:5-oxoprolinase subunit PxpB [Methylobacteriaceae bacterium]
MQRDRAREAPHVSPMGLGAVLFEAPGAFDLAAQRRVWALARAVEAWPGVVEAAPGMTNLLVSFDAPLRDPGAVERALIAAWDAAAPLDVEPRRFELPVVYGGEGGPDLDHMARETGLTRDEVVAIHAGRDYTVFALGSHPGYGYLGVVDPRLFIPRRQTPRVSVPAGSVSIGGWQTGASASDGPSGWHTIGHTSQRFFDPGGSPPALLRPGDVIRFVATAILP